MLDVATVHSMALAAAAMVHTWAGREPQARHAAKQSRAVLDHPFPSLAIWQVSSLGALELSLGHFDAAASRLAPLAQALLASELREPMWLHYLPDVIEALVALARLDDAEPLIAWLEERGHDLDRPWALATAARCRGLTLAARGDLDEGEQCLHQALAHHERLGMPIERARTLLVLGQIQRRRNQRRAARVSLDAALAVFDHVGAALWADRTRAELRRLGLRTPAPQGLTDSEARVGALAASGLTNREVAAALFVSPKTVEANLARVYRKLGIRSRAELGRRLTEGAIGPQPTET